MRHVMVTPVSRLDVLVTALRDLRFQEVMMSFGYFALHNVNISQASLSDIDKEDPPKLQKAYKLRTHKSRAAPTTMRLLPNVSEEYPWGNFLTIERLKELLKGEPSQFLRDPDTVEEKSLKHPDSSRLFTLFSQQIWMLSVDNNQSQEQAGNLEEAMARWSHNEIQQTGYSITFLPTYEGLPTQGDPKLPQTPSFLEARGLFFPDQNDLKNHPCQCFADYGYGYLFQYYKILENGSLTDTEDLNNDLNCIFGLLQCLPGSSQHRTRPVIWRYSDENELLFIANPRYYRAEGVCVDPKPIKKIFKKRAQVANPSMRKRMHEYG